MSSSRVFNFSAGPAAVPLECLERAASEMTTGEILECLLLNALIVAKPG